MLNREKYVAQVEEYTKILCHEIREKAGLNPEPGLDCQGEPCRCACPFIETEEEDLEAEANTNLYRAIMEGIR